MSVQRTVLGEHGVGRGGNRGWGVLHGRGMGWGTSRMGDSVLVVVACGRAGGLMLVVGVGYYTAS